MDLATMIFTTGLWIHFANFFSPPMWLAVKFLEGANNANAD